MHTALTILIFFLPFGVHSQKIFINQLPEYSQLPSCAEPPLSTIVRNMASGCGDGGKTTSYACFCASSSAEFESIISKAVASKCAPAFPDATASALRSADSCRDWRHYRYISRANSEWLNGLGQGLAYPDSDTAGPHSLGE
ncbi:hypothetical protein QBC44DRAFT_385478 [Cladorrhinum sp. PSN332]|nr:hypothetical protein QBC44DRAFT_385478 [Cladorrhinum sp. PSN332]